MPGNNHSSRQLTWFLLSGVLIFACLKLWPNPYVASDLSIVPDSVEYAVAAKRFYLNGSYTIPIEGKEFPPRYPPFFSIVGLGWVYSLSAGAQGSPEIGNGVYPVFLYALVGVAATFGIGFLLGGPMSGAVAALAIVEQPYYRVFSRSIMSDVPSTAFILLAMFWFMWLRRKSKLETKDFFVAGVIATLAGFRPLGLLAAVPFLLILPRTGSRLGDRLRAIFALGILPGLLTLLTCVYNWRAFGSPFRSGYSFWCLIPYDYFSSLIISAEDFPLALYYWFIKLGLLLGIVALAFSAMLIRRGILRSINTSDLTSALIFLAFIGITLSAALLSLFYQPDQFQRLALPLTSIAFACAGACGWGLLKDLFSFRSAIMIVIAMVLGFELFSSLRKEIKPSRRILADRLSAQLPDDAILISALDPVYLNELVVRNTKRQTIPISRRVEYASKLIAPRRLPPLKSQPSRWNDHRFPALVEAGAKEAVDLVALEDLDQIDALLDLNRKIFVDLGSVNAEEKGELTKHYHLEKISPELARLEHQAPPPLEPKTS